MKATMPSGRASSGRASARTPVRTAGGRRPGAPGAGRRRLLRQRLAVFVVVTVLAAVIIATVQGCHHF